MNGRSTMHIGKAIILQIEEDYEKSCTGFLKNIKLVLNSITKLLFVKKNREIEGISAQLELLPFDEFFRFFIFQFF